MDDLMTFPETWEEFERSYGFTDTDEVYTNGSRLIQSFRVKQWLEQMQTADAVQVVRCKDCKYFDLDHFENFRGIPLIVAHEICNRWGNGCKTDSNGFCFMGERRSE